MQRFMMCWLALLSACAADNGVESQFAYLAPCGETESPPAADACLFGEVFADVRSNPALLITSETWIRTVEELPELDGQQLLLAVQQSSHTDVTTPAEALARVDQAEVRKIVFYELASERWFAVYEYGAGDNSYGAYFPLDGTDVLAAIHDGDVLSCTVIAADSGG